MSTAKTAFLSLLIACWIAGLVSQFHSFGSTLLYLTLSLLIVAAVAFKRQYRTQYAKNRVPPRR